MTFKLRDEVLNLRRSIEFELLIRNSQYLDHGVTNILLEEDRDILWVILRFPNDVMYLRSDINLSIQHSSILLKLCTNTADASLPKLCVNCFRKPLRLVRVYLALGDRCSSSPRALLSRKSGTRFVSE
jgi:hypothetical protein